MFALHPGSHVTHLGHLLWAHDHMEEMLWYIYVKGYIFEDCKRCNVQHKCSLDILSNLTVIRWYLYWYRPNLLKVSECKHTMQVFVMLSIWSLFRWVGVEIVMFDSRIVISSIYFILYIYTDRILKFFHLHLTQFILFTNYICKQITIDGRQFEFREAKVIVRCWTL